MCTCTCICVFISYSDGSSRECICSELIRSISAGFWFAYLCVRENLWSSFSLLKRLCWVWRCSWGACCIACLLFKNLCFEESMQNTTGMSYKFSKDFQEYAKPLRLLSATEAKSVTGTLDEKMVASFKSGETESLYKVKLQTSNISGSSLTDLNAAVLLCLIDENGSSILQRLPAVENKILPTNDDMDDILHFQRGSTDEFVFEGPGLGKIVAVWISLESGQWRAGGVSLSMFRHSQLSSGNSQIREHNIGFQYNFEVEDILLGEKSGLSLMEFRPYSVTTLSEDEFNLFLEKTVQPSYILESRIISNEESMKEYSDLKFSLLFYDAMLILAGSSIISIVTGNDVSYAFLIGGTSGFLYLLLLQRSVDGLQTQELIPEGEKMSSGQILERFKAPILSLVLVFAFAAIAVKYASGEGAVQLTPKDIIFGMMGFLICKVSVVLAAFKPLPFGLRRGHK